MRRPLLASAAVSASLALAVAACGSSNSNSGNIGRTVQREIQSALSRSAGAAADLELERCVAPQVGVSLPDATSSDVSDSGQGNDTLDFDCTVTRSTRSASAPKARWEYDLQLQATGQWQASLRSGSSSASAPLALSGGQTSQARSTQGTKPVAATAPAPDWGKGLTAMSAAEASKTLKQAHVNNTQNCLAVATANGYPRYAIARVRPVAACTTPPAGTASEYFLQRTAGVWQNDWEGNTGCPPALPAPLIKAMFNLPASSCEDS